MVTLTREYRIVLPLKIEEYDIGQLYTVIEMTKEDETTKIEILENRETEVPENKDAGKCQKTLKVMDFNSYFPSFIKRMLSSKAMKIHETSYNAFPVCKTRYHSPALDEKTFSMTVDSIHVNGLVNENVFKLTKEERDKIEVVYIEIDKNISNKMFDPTNFNNERSGKIMLKDNWIDSCIKNNLPIMTCYKLVKIEIDFFSGGMIANMICKEFAKLLKSAHQRIYSSCDMWIKLSKEDIRRMEKEVFSKKGLK